jgi:hypothetical protein
VFSACRAWNRRRDVLGSSRRGTGILRGNACTGRGRTENVAQYIRSSAPGGSPRGRAYLRLACRPGVYSVAGACGHGIVYVAGRYGGAEYVSRGMPGSSPRPDSVRPGRIRAGAEYTAGGDMRDGVTCGATGDGTSAGAEYGTLHGMCPSAVFPGAPARPPGRIICVRWRMLRGAK